MVEIPDRLECLFSTSIDQQSGSYRIEVPQSELEEGTISTGGTYRVAIVSGTPVRTMPRLDSNRRPLRRHRSRIRIAPPSSHRQLSRATYVR